MFHKIASCDTGKWELLYPQKRKKELKMQQGLPQNDDTRRSMCVEGRMKFLQTPEGGRSRSCRPPRVVAAARARLLNRFRSIPTAAQVRRRIAVESAGAGAKTAPREQRETARARGGTPGVARKLRSAVEGAQKSSDVVNCYFWRPVCP